ncbi:MAG: tetratricopeptide repeat protein [Akkermansiaceae bacterium]|nr:tetratricopeptide repeat protein [Akkermansiaceae bacterium]
MITTDSKKAQDYFNQGLAFLHAFNHDEAIRSFEEAARHDPDCAMAHWAIALACGPHINNPVVPPARAEQAFREVTLARKHAASGTPIEQALITALGARYADPPPEDRVALDQAYAEAMRTVWKAYPNDPDVGAFFAEALMDLRPWDLWTTDGKAQPGTMEILGILEATMRRAPNHPLANHLYIHAVEAGPNPELADAAADRLRSLQPGMGHNTHMPSHIDVLRGRWHEAIEANEKAIAADRQYRATARQQPDFFRMYMAHNRHMLAYAAMMTGQGDRAVKHIDAMVEEIPEEWLKTNAVFADGFAAMPYEVLVRFGRWDDILAKPEPADYLPFSRAMRHAARGIAHAALGDATAARREQSEFAAARGAVPEEWVLGNNECREVLALVADMLEGEILYREGKVDAGLAALRMAAEKEDQLRYDEPPGWILPVRHALGATLMQERRFAEAEDVYRTDLKRRPENGWSLFGLAESLRRQGKTAEAAPVRERFETMWAKADLAINSSCLCQPGL